MVKVYSPASPHFLIPALLPSSSPFISWLTGVVRKPKSKHEKERKEALPINFAGVVVVPPLNVIVM